MNIRCGILAIFVMTMMLGFYGIQAEAQTVNITNETLTSENMASQRAQTEVRTKVKDLITQLKESQTPSEIRTIAARILEPLGYPNASDGFKQFWSSEAALQASEIMRGRNYTPTQKAAVLGMAAELTVGMGNSLTIRGLESKNPAIRYWSANSIKRVVFRARAEGAFMAEGAQLRENLRIALAKAVKGETSPIVLEESYSALGVMNTPTAIDAIAAALEDNIVAYERGAPNALRADQEGINQLGTALRRTQSRMTPPEYRKLLDRSTIIAVKYAQFARLMLALNKVKPQDYAAAMNMLSDTEFMLMLALRSYAASEYEKYLIEEGGTKILNPELSVQTAVENNDFQAANARLDNWIRLVLEKTKYESSDFAVDTSKLLD